MKNKTLQKNIFGILLLAAFSCLAYGVRHHLHIINSIDNAFWRLMDKTFTPLNTTIFKFVAFLSSPLVVFAITFLLCIWLWRKQGLIAALWIASLQIFGSALTIIIKHFVARPRPSHQLFSNHGFSFPSGHVFCTTILIFSLLTIYLSLIKDQENQLVFILAGMIWIGFVGASRVYLHNHFGTDVIAGFLFGSSSWLIVTPYEQVFKQTLHKFLGKSI